MDYTVYKLAAQAHGFYDIPIWRIGEPAPAYASLFIWRKAHYMTGSPDINSTGILNESLFDTIEKKIAYIQGVFEDVSEGSGIRQGKNYLTFANSSNKVERCKKWINEITKHMIPERTLFSNKPEDVKYTGLFSWGVKEHNILYMCPICHTLLLEPVVVEYIKNYQL